MIDVTILELKSVTEHLKKSILLDIEDVKKANHENLVKRNSDKLTSMDILTNLKQQLNNELSQEYKSGNDISIYKTSIDELEVELQNLYSLNGKLASIVLPVKEMYKEIIDEITEKNGGSLVEVMA
ncbi:hypothetical protein ALC152_09180 [Arcobacter sp. 15-2]|uniref:hypothetical protein n=1 Tax=Arcobacter sp. 15-2 TaxID=3374109 RepID=UPI00399D4FA2